MDQNKTNIKNMSFFRCRFETFHKTGEHIDQRCQNKKGGKARGLKKQKINKQGNVYPELWSRHSTKTQVCIISQYPKNAYFLVS